MESTILIIKTFVVVIGFSTAFINDFLTFRFLKDFRITKDEQKVLCELILIILISLLLITMVLGSSFFYGIPKISQEVLITSNILLLVIIFIEMISRRIIAKLTKCRLEPTTIDVDKIVMLRKTAFVLNTISVLSWVYLLVVLLPTS